MSEYTDLINVFNGRAAFYEFFTEAFNEPASAEFVETIRSFAPHFKNMAAEIDSKDLIEGAAELEAFLKLNVEPDDLNRSFTTLFLLGGNSIPTAESVYLSTTKLMKQEPWDEIIKVYYEFNYGVPADMNQTEEHISSEMLFMYFLSKKSAMALEENKEEEAEKFIEGQKDFMEKHILRWIPELCGFVINSKYEHIVLYKTLAKLLRGFLYYDKELLEELTKEEA